MKLNETACAKSLALLSGAAYLICLASFILFPRATLWIFDAWFHGVDITVLPMRIGPASIFVVGFTTLVAAAYAAGYAFASLYNRFLTEK